MLTYVKVCEVYTHACGGQRWTLVPYQLLSTLFIRVSRSHLLSCLFMLVGECIDAEVQPPWRAVLSFTFTWF